MSIGGELGGDVAKGGGDGLDLCGWARLASRAMRKCGSWYTVVRSTWKEANKKISPKLNRRHQQPASTDPALLTVREIVDSAD